MIKYSVRLFQYCRLSNDDEIATILLSVTSHLRKNCFPAGICLPAYPKQKATRRNYIQVKLGIRNYRFLAMFFFHHLRVNIALHLLD